MVGCVDDWLFLGGGRVVGWLASWIVGCVHVCIPAGWTWCVSVQVVLMHTVLEIM